MSIYLQIVAAILIFGMLLPQKGRYRLAYIILMTVIHTFVLGLRYQFLTGDLHKYYWGFLNRGGYGWFSPELWAGGRNSGFFLLNKLIYILSGGEFQAFLFFIALVEHLVLGYVIYRYSPAPWMSYLVWDCMALYLFGFSAIKQALAMAFVMLSFVGIAEKNLKIYLLAMGAAISVHMPALVFLPTYWLAQQKASTKMLLLYFVAGVLIFVFKNQFVQIIKSIYYDDDASFTYGGSVGGRFIMVLGFGLFGVLFTGFSDRTFEKLYHIMMVAAIFQMLSGFDNIFTRLTDYYFQMSVLYIPMTFFPKKRANGGNILRPIFPFNQRSLRFMAVCIVLFLLWFYYTCNINITISYEVDNYLNFRFMWDVQ